MGVSLTQTSSSMLPEYAATSIRINRSVNGVAGKFVASFTVSIDYEKKIYILNEAGEKIGTVSLPSETPNPLVMPHEDETRGSIYLDAAKTQALFGKTITNEMLGDVIADLADELIREDLIRRGIITEV